MTLEEAYILLEDTVPAFCEYANRALKGIYYGETKDETRLNSAKKYSCWKNLIDNFQLGNVRFENIKIKNTVQDVIKLLLTK